MERRNHSIEDLSRQSWGIGRNQGSRASGMGGRIRGRVHLHYLKGERASVVSLDFLLLSGCFLLKVLLIHSCQPLQALLSRFQS